MRLTVAGFQMAVTEGVKRNVESIRRAIQKASQMGAEILLTPEGSLSGYTPDFDQDEVATGLAEVTALAKEKGIGLALGTCFVEADSNCYNQLRFYRPDGTFLGFHSKILRCHIPDHPTEGEINYFAATELRTFNWSNLTIGGLICNDMWANPEYTPMPDSHLSRQLAAMGARIIFHPVNGGRDGSEWSQITWDYHKSNLQLRARSRGLWIVTADSCTPVGLSCSAPSGVISPEGRWVCTTDPVGEHLFVHTVEF